MSITDMQIRALTIPESGREEHVIETQRGAGALVLRVSSSGRKSFFARCRVDGKLVREKLGDYGRAPNLTLAAARAMLPEAIGRLRAQARAPVIQIAETPPITIEMLADSFIEARAASVSAKTIQNYKQILSAYVVPALGKKQVSDVTSADLFTLCETERRRGHLSTGNHIYVACRAMMNYALGCGFIESVPSLPRGNRPANPRPERTRALSQEEIRDFLRLSPRFLNPQIRLALWLSLSTGQRVGEVCPLQEKEISGNIWALAGEEHRHHQIYLSEFSLMILNEARRFSDGSGYLFPARRGTTPHILPGSLPSALRKQFFPRSGFPHRAFVAHDLRRSCVTHLAEQGFSLETIERIVNHAPGGHMNSLIAVYNRAEYREQIKNALDWWGITLQGWLREG